MIWIIYIAIVLLVGIIFLITSRRKSSQTFETTYEAPTKIDRTDFPENQADTLVALFTSKTCGSCADVISKAKILESEYVSIALIDFEDAKSKKLHEKYQIEAVPTIAVCDINGVVSYSNVGPVTATDLWAGVARVRGNDIQICGEY